jgi:CRP/FNR family transcriptional regulator, anaerobic regulatory protein
MRELQQLTAEALALYPVLTGLMPIAGALSSLAVPVTLPGAAVVFRENEPCKGFPLVLEGEVRVSRNSAEGRSIELYRIFPGELCLVSSACLFRSEPLPAHGVAVGNTTLLLIAPETFDHLLEQRAFRAWVLGLFADRMVDLAAAVDAAAFHKLDRRLAGALLGHGRELAVTHQELADTIGTVREMVTRLLLRFERQHWIELSRERIRIIDSAALRRCAAGG